MGVEPVLLLPRWYVPLRLTSVQEPPLDFRDEANRAPWVQAGLAAYFLAHPDYQDRFRYSSHDYANSNTVGKRMRDFLVELAYQRVPADRLLHPDHLADYRYSPNAVVPPSVVVLYNGYHGDQKNRTD